MINFYSIKINPIITLINKNYYLCQLKKNSLLLFNKKGFLREQYNLVILDSIHTLL
jgi:hypothetical protein